MQIKFNNQQKIYVNTKNNGTLIVSEYGNEIKATKEGTMGITVDNLVDALEILGYSNSSEDVVLTTLKELRTEANDTPLIDYVEINTEDTINTNDKPIDEAEALEVAFKFLAGSLVSDKKISVAELGSIDSKLATISKLLESYDGKVNKSNNKKADEEHEWAVLSKNKEDFNSRVFNYELSDIKNKLEIKRALLLQGVPGTGKTRIMTSLLDELTSGNTERYSIISFSQNTDYSDFIGGITNVEGDWVYKNGSLMDMCIKADKDRENNYYLGIDEMSRANVEAVFGELMTCIEQRELLVSTNSGRKIRVPSNLYIIGTMNTLDNSTKRLDAATLERFTNYSIMPQWSSEYIDWLTKDSECDEDTKKKLYKISKIMSKINNAIGKDSLLGYEYVIGTRAISGVSLTEDNIDDILINKLIPTIEKRTRSSREYETYRNEIMRLEEVVEGGHGD